ncbi:hypothetical protein GGF32_004410 [Allomyces javanicus]|nr:hypothetical protein GGF32_004410 [Allomyces javanicus]
MLSKDHRFSKLVDVVKRVGGNLRDDLDSQESMTLFAPTNDAFEAMLSNHGGAVLNDDRMMSAIIRYHVVAEKDMKMDDLHDGKLLETELELAELGHRKQVIRVVQLGKRRVLLNMYSRIIDSDMEAANGMVHAVSEVLIPPSNALELATLLPAEFSIHALALHVTGMAKRVGTSNAISALVPSNTAWKKVGYLKLMELFHPCRRHTLKKVVENHYASKMIFAKDVHGKGDKNSRCGEGVDSCHQRMKMPVETWSGQVVEMMTEENRHGRPMLMVDGIPTLIQDLPIGNGVMHVVDRVLMDEDEDSDQDLDLKCNTQMPPPAMAALIKDRRD